MNKIKFVAVILLIVITLNLVLPVLADSSDIAGISNNTVYYLKNVKYGNYLYVSNGSLSLGANVLCNTFAANSSHKWKLIRVSSGNYKIASLVSSDRLLTRNTSDNNNAVIDATESPNTYQKFTVVRMTSGTNAGLYYIKNGNYNYLIEESNGNVKFSSSISGQNYLWSLEKVTKGSAKHYCFKFQTDTVLFNTPVYFDTTGSATYFNNKALSMGYSPSVSINSNATDAYNSITGSDIFFFHGHGSNARILFFNTSNQSTGNIFANNSQCLSNSDKAISNLSTNALANARCILYMGCSTGLSSNGYNLINESFAKGAHFAIGTTKTVYAQDVNKWCKCFFYKASKGFCIEQCIQYANKHCNKLGTLYYKGDIYQKLG